MGLKYLTRGSPQLFVGHSANWVTNLLLLFPTCHVESTSFPNTVSALFHPCVSAQVLVQRHKNLKIPARKRSPGMPPELLLLSSEHLVCMPVECLPENFYLSRGFSPTQSPVLNVDCLFAVYPCFSPSGLCLTSWPRVLGLRGLPIPHWNHLLLASTSSAIEVLFFF